MRKRARAADERVFTLEMKLADAKAAHARLVDVFAQSEADVTKVEVGFESCKVRLDEVGRASKLESACMDDAWKPSAELAKAALEPLRRLTCVSSQAHFLEKKSVF